MRSLETLQAIENARRTFLRVRIAEVSAGTPAEVGPRIELTGADKDRTDQHRALLPKVLAILRTRTERDFSRYKSATLLRRIARRMQLNYLNDLPSTSKIAVPVEIRYALAKALHG